MTRLLGSYQRTCLCVLIGLQIGGSACGYVAGFTEAESPRGSFERGYFAEMAAVEGYPAARLATGVHLFADQAYRTPASKKDAAAWLLDVWVPAACNRPWPMVVYAHGGGLDAGAKDDETRVNTNLAIALAQQGFVVFNINHRLASQKPHPAQAQDMAAAVRWAEKNGPRFGGDPTRIVLSGFSSGGYLAALVAGDLQYIKAAGVSPRHLRAVVAVSGFFDLEQTAKPFFVRRFIVEPAFGRRGPAWRSASPTHHTGSHWPPTLLLSAEKDRSAQPQSDALCAKLRRAGVVCQRLVVPHSEHSTAIARLGNGRAGKEFRTVVDFMRTHLH